MGTRDEFARDPGNRERDVLTCLELSRQRIEEGHPPLAVGEALADAVGPLVMGLELYTGLDDEPTHPVCAPLAARFQELSVLAGGDEQTVEQIESAAFLHQLAEPYVGFEDQERYAARGRHLATRWGELDPEVAAALAAQDEADEAAQEPGPAWGHPTDERCALGAAGDAHHRPPGRFRMAVPLTSGTGRQDPKILRYPLCDRCARRWTARAASLWIAGAGFLLMAGGFAMALWRGWPLTPCAIGAVMFFLGEAAGRPSDRALAGVQLLPEVAQLARDGWKVEPPRREAVPGEQDDPARGGGLR